MVRTTALDIVVCGVKVRDEELEDISDEVGVIEDSEDVEESCELDEELRLEVVEEDVVDGVSEVEERSVDVDGGVDVLGGTLVVVGGGSLSTQISGPTLGDESAVRTKYWAVETAAERIPPPRCWPGHSGADSLNFA